MAKIIHGVVGVVLTAHDGPDGVVLDGGTEVEGWWRDTYPLILPAEHTLFTRPPFLPRVDHCEVCGHDFEATPSGYAAHAHAFELGLLDLGMHREGGKVH